MVENTTINEKKNRLQLVEAFGSGLTFNRDLAPFSSYNCGGAAKYFIAAKSADEILRFLKNARRFSLPVFILGGGTNILVSDSGYDGLVIKVDIKGLKIFDETGIECGAGEKLTDLVDFATENSLTGLEFATGIYGTVGGAVYGNAGAFGGEIGKVVKEVSLLNPDEGIKTVSSEYCGFGYRDSRLKKTGEVIISAKIRLDRGNQKEIRDKVNEINEVRYRKHPVNEMSAGCFFKNIPDSKEKNGKLPAGRLLEQIGAKGMSVGGAKVYEKHANIIVNTGKATSKDISDLADILKKKVNDKFGIMLEDEIVKVGIF